ncbi:hypothetical protein [Variovorax gossypii]|uniref:hypothetical protein n=1 Tax=uncultured Variovorax sp. TaxID=114708 RepID=UPI002610B750|nr:hypothetical protein [uncultured Variovorax sp.]
MTTTQAALPAEVIETLAAFIAGDTPHQSIGLAMPPNGSQRLKERAHRFFALRRALRVDGWQTEEEIRAALVLSFGPQQSRSST